MNPAPSSLPDLTNAILARTSGPACGRLRELACDFVDGTLPADDGDLVLGHLEHCPACQGLVARLRAAALVLPTFATLNPGASFTASVLRRTHPATVLAPVPDPLLAGWARLMRRPRAALEAAYLATAAGLILTQLPLPAPLRLIPTALVARVRRESRDSLAQLRARGEARGGAWSQRPRAFLPVHTPGPRPGAWSTLWSRLERLRHRSWRALVQTARQLRARAWPAAPTALPPATEPAKAPLRSAL
jgi:anti-sigma factor RsiW